MNNLINTHTLKAGLCAFAFFIVCLISCDLQQLNTINILLYLLYSLIFAIPAYFISKYQKENEEIYTSNELTRNDKYKRLAIFSIIELVFLFLTFGIIYYMSTIIVPPIYYIFMPIIIIIPIIIGGIVKINKSK